MLKNTEKMMIETYGIKENAFEIYKKALADVEEQFKLYDEIREYNQLKVLNAFQEERISDMHFTNSSGYGYDDIGRDTLDKVYARIFNTESALVRPHFVNGTHAIGCALMGNLRTGDTMVCITGAPYDTLHNIIGISGKENIGSLKEYGVNYKQVDLKNGTLTEETAQELMDHFIMKLRLVRFLRTPEYNELFSGDPVWVTESIGGMGIDGRTLVTKNSFRILHTLENLGPAPEPNLTVLWSTRLPEGFKRYTSKLSIKTSSIQYENDDVMRITLGDDYGIACCVSPMKIGKQMQFFGARANLAKTLLYAINGGRDEKSGKQVTPKFAPITSEYLDYEEVMEKFDQMMDYVAKIYIKALDAIHYMHDKYSYEAIEMALHDKDILQTMACGIAGLSVVADSLSAIKYAKVKVIRDETGLAVDYEIDGDFPKFGNDDDRVDQIAVDIVRTFIKKLRKYPTYKNSKHTLSILTITSNVVYGKATGNTPDGRKAGAPFGPGANPLHGRDTNGALAVMNSIAKLPFDAAEDGISYTFAITPNTLGKDEETKVNNMVSMLDGFFAQTGHHINVNVFDRSLLEDAMEHPEKYPQLTIRVSGYAVNFVKLTREQQLDVINRTIHERI